MIIESTVYIVGRNRNTQWSVSVLSENLNQSQTDRYDYSAQIKMSLAIKQNHLFTRHLLGRQKPVHITWGWPVLRNLSTSALPYQTLYVEFLVIFLQSVCHTNMGPMNGLSFMEYEEPCWLQASQNKIFPEQTMVGYIVWSRYLLMEMHHFENNQVWITYGRTAIIQE